MFGLYALALFGFNALDPVALARAAAIEQMREGMVVVDVEGQIVDANPSAERALGEPVASSARPRRARGAAGRRRSDRDRRSPTARESEFDVGSGDEKRRTISWKPRRSRTSEGTGWATCSCCRT